MIHFNYTSEELLTIRIVDDFSNLNMERIAVLLEGSYDSSSDKGITFQVESDLPKEQMQLLGDFCKRLPYESNIDLKYPLLVW